MQDEKQYEYLEDVSATGNKRDWDGKKFATDYLALAYEQLENERLAARVRDCATFLGFKVNGAEKKLFQANFCRARLCPMCNWRRSMKVYANVMKIGQELKKQNGSVFIFLTLTVRNVGAQELAETISAMFKAWNRLTGYKAVKRAVKGWYRGLEVTHNLRKNNRYYDTYHPHFHCMLEVSEDYFTGSDYLSQKDWQELWQKAMNLDYEPIVDVRKMYGDLEKSMAEVSKYCVKESELLDYKDLSITAITVDTMTRALHGRRLIAYGGTLRKLHKQLNLDDEENGDLINTDGAEKPDGEQEVFYFWNTGYSLYCRLG